MVGRHMANRQRAQQDRGYQDRAYQGGGTPSDMNNTPGTPQ